jgi:hypothetical protein
MLDKNSYFFAEFASFIRTNRFNLAGIFLSFVFVIASASVISPFDRSSVINAFETSNIERCSESGVGCTYLQTGSIVRGDDRYVGNKTLIRNLHAQLNKSSFSFFSPVSSDGTPMSFQMSFRGKSIGGFSIADTSDYWNDYVGTDFFTAFRMLKVDKTSNGFYNNARYSSGVDGASYISSKIADKMIESLGNGATYSDVLGSSYSVLVNGIECILSINNIYVEGQYLATGIDNYFGPMVMTDCGKIFSNLRFSTFYGLSNEFVAYQTLFTEVAGYGYLDDDSILFNSSKILTKEKIAGSSYFMAAVVSRQNGSLISLNGPMPIIFLVILIMSVIGFYCFLLRISKSVRMLYSLEFAFFLSFVYAIVVFSAKLIAGSYTCYLVFSVFTGIFGLVVPLFSTILCYFLSMVVGVVKRKGKKNETGC